MWGALAVGFLLASFWPLEDRHPGFEEREVGLVSVTTGKGANSGTVMDPRHEALDGRTFVKAACAS